ncbi:MAG: phosphoenolpyruvate synthase [Kofleriaceae bacterium]
MIDLRDIDRTMGPSVGGKAANLGELMRIEGVRVPAGFVVTDDRPITIRDGVYAVRSSATAEDLADASFAGQYDTYLNVDAADVPSRIEACRASLDTERAIAYRREHGITGARMAVVVQDMVAAEISGVMFTADPVTGNRKVIAIDAVRGAGEAYVSGHANTNVELSRERVASLEQLGRRIEAHFGAPQDIEWCIAGDTIWIVQSRPITTLYPIPDDTPGPHVYLSVGHQQMMTDAIRPLGLSIWLMTTPASMRVAGGRLFVDIAPMLAGPNRTSVVATLGADPLIKDALSTILDRGFVPVSDQPAKLPPVFGPPPAVDDDPAIVAGLIARSEASLAAMQREIATKSGAELFDFIAADVKELQHKFLREPQTLLAIRASMDAAAWIDEHVETWLGEPHAADVLSQSAPNNVTAEMGLALLDVADVIRASGDFTAPEAVAAMAQFLDRYGMRCTGEIDITRTRWAEDPSALHPAIRSNIAMFAPGESRRKFERGLAEAAAKQHDILERLRRLPDGEAKADETARKISLLRTFVGYREYPKFAMIARYFEYRKALLREAARLGIGEDAYYLTFEEMRAGDVAAIAARKAAYKIYDRLSPPRVMTSDGEILTGSYHRTVPNALVGVPVSTGVVEGRARVIARIEDAMLEAGDILVTTFTDPSWTPLFVSIVALVTEIGGRMTHGAVIAREYGLPAVVGVTDATTKIADGQRIRVDGTTGVVELL